MVELVPSILSADFSKPGLRDPGGPNAAAALLSMSTSWMVTLSPNLTMGPPVVKSLRKVTNLPLDCHLMIENPDDFIEEFAAAGASWITVHYEACRHLHRTLQLIAQHGVEPSVAINPATRVDFLVEILPMVHHVLVMTVNPGFGGQKFIPFSLEKIRQTAALRAELGLNFRIEVDGGVAHDTIASVVEAGADFAGCRQRCFRLRAAGAGSAEAAHLGAGGGNSAAKGKNFHANAGCPHLTLS